MNVEFTLDQLSMRERLGRMGPDTDPGVALAKGIMALRSKAYSHADGYFARTGPALSKRLAQGIEKAKSAQGRRSC